MYVDPVHILLAVYLFYVTTFLVPNFKNSQVFFLSMRMILAIGFFVNTFTMLRKFPPIHSLLIDVQLLNAFHGFIMIIPFLIQFDNMS